MNLRRAVLPLISFIALAYVALHSPALAWIGRGLGHRVGRCYFSCGGWIAGRPVDMIAGWVLLAVAGGAAWRLAGHRLGGPVARPRVVRVTWRGPPPASGGLPWGVPLGVGGAAPGP